MVIIYLLMLALAGCAPAYSTAPDGRQLQPDFFNDRCIEGRNGHAIAIWPSGHGNVIYCDLRDSPLSVRR